MKIMHLESNYSLTLKDIEKALFRASNDKKATLLEIYISNTIFNILKVDISQIAIKFRAYSHIADVLERLELNNKIKEKISSVAYKLMVNTIEFYKKTGKCKESILALRLAQRLSKLASDEITYGKILYNTGVVMTRCDMRGMGMELIKIAKQILNKRGL